VSELIGSGQTAATTESITPRVDADIREAYPSRMWKQVKEEAALKTYNHTCTSGVSRDGTKSVWDEYQKAEASASAATAASLPLLLPRASPRAAVGAEVRRQVELAAPLVACSLLQYSLQVVSVMFAGHLGELSLSGASVAATFANVTGFSVLVRSNRASV